MITVDQTFLVVSGEGARLRLDTNGVINAPDLVLMQGGLLELNGGSAFVSDTMNVVQLTGSPIKGIAKGRGILAIGQELNVRGTIEASGGTLQIGRTSVNAVIDLDGDDEIQFFGELIARSNATLFVSAPIHDAFDGPLFVEQNGTARFNAAFALGRNGVASIDGTLEVNDLLTAADVWAIDGRIQLGPSGIVSGDLLPYVTNHGTVSGYGNFPSGLIVDTGELSPGEALAPGTITAAEALLASGSTLSIDVGPTADKFAVSGALFIGEPSQNGGPVTPGGRLRIELEDGYQPAAGDTFDILDFEDVDGGFETFTLPSLPASLVWNLDSLYTDGVLSVGLSGDYDRNGIVDAADYVVWRKSDGSSAGYGTWRENFGRTVGTGGDADDATGVPEPMTLNLVSLVTLIVVNHRHRIRIGKYVTRCALQDHRSDQPGRPTQRQEAV